MDNGKYHSRLSEKMPINMKKKRFDFIYEKHHIEIPRKSVELIIHRNMSLTRWPLQLVNLFFVCHPIIVYLTQPKWFRTN